MKIVTKSNKCILDEKKRGGCTTCPPHCPHKIALNGLNGDGGRIGSAGIPDGYRGVTLKNSAARESQEALYQSLDRYVASFGGDDVKSVYLYSVSPGTGKTTTACALLNEWISRKYVEYLRKGESIPQDLGMFLDINELQSDYNMATILRNVSGLERITATISKAQRTPYLVIDDIGVRDATEAFRGYVHAIINHRVGNGLPTVYTSNLEISELEDVFDSRLYDRIRSNTGVMRFVGESKRKHVGK